MQAVASYFKVTELEMITPNQGKKIAGQVIAVMLKI